MPPITHRCPSDTSTCLVTLEAGAWGGAEIVTRLLLLKSSHLFNFFLLLAMSQWNSYQLFLLWSNISRGDVISENVTSQSIVCFEICCVSCKRSFLVNDTIA